MQSPWNRARRGERIWAAYRVVGEGREAALVNYVWECTYGGLHNVLFTVEYKQQSMERLRSPIRAPRPYRIHVRTRLTRIYIFRATVNRAGAKWSQRRFRSIDAENALYGSQLMALLIIYSAIGFSPPLCEPVYIYYERGTRLTLDYTRSFVSSILSRYIYIEAPPHRCELELDVNIETIAISKFLIDKLLYRLLCSVTK